MIAHSAGGACASAIISDYKEDCIKRLKFVGFTDACQGNFDSKFKGEEENWVKNSCVAFDASDLKLGKKTTSFWGSSRNKFPQLSAGHEKHVYTTGCSWPMMRKYILANSNLMRARDDWETIKA
jgi:hypothetical protein